MLAWVVTFQPPPACSGPVSERHPPYFLQILRHESRITRYELTSISMRCALFHFPYPVSLCLPLLRKTAGGYQYSQKGTHMNPQTALTITNSDSVSLHCQHRTASGRRCRMAISDPHSGLCRKHAVDRQKELEEADLAASSSVTFRNSATPSPSTTSLGELYKLLAKNKITPRRGCRDGLHRQSPPPHPPAIAYENNSRPALPASRPALSPALANGDPTGTMNPTSSSIMPRPDRD